MIRLHPTPEVTHACPHCHVPLEVRGWYIPGMRNLADLACSRCGREFYGDLPAGHGLYYPMLLDKASGAVHDRLGVSWFAHWLRDSYSHRVTQPIPFVQETFRHVRTPVLLNCLDTLYGHSLLKLLNAQYYLERRPDLDPVLLIPRFLRWMVPEGVAAVWTVDLPLARGVEWNDHLASQIDRLIKPYDECWLSLGFSHPHPADFNIERFTRVRPFPIEAWTERLKRPTVTFVWRDDSERLWRDRTRHEGYLRFLSRTGSGDNRISRAIRTQTRRVVQLGITLREVFAHMDFAVAGIGTPGGLPQEILDLRSREVDEKIETEWCRRYAKSHLVIGVHGSNMLLPSAHAGAVLELVPDDRWGNLAQDILPPAEDLREAMLRYQFLPLHTSVAGVCRIAASLLRSMGSGLLNFTKPWCDHAFFSRDPLNAVSELERKASDAHRAGIDAPRPFSKGS